MLKFYGKIMKKEIRFLYFKEEGEEILMMIMMMIIVMMMMIVVMMNEWSGKNKEIKYINDYIYVFIN